jgi:hypothetical protein
MKYFNFILFGMLVCAGASAQTDSTYIDLGRMRARKEFIQTTVIKASDLAQMPFTTLSDVIRLWVNGSYSDKSTMVYVIDGVMINDVDAYSIFDIEEIIIVNDALSQPNGASNLQTLALIKTKGVKSTKPHFSFAGQAFAVTKKENGQKYTTEVFHQYGLSGSGNIGKVSVGGSLNYLHDPMPNNDSVKVATTPNIDRFRLHLWAQTKLGRKSTLALQGNYTPQDCHSNFTSYSPYVISSYVRNYNESLINASLQLQTAFTSRLQNKFSAGYTNGIQKAFDSTGNLSVNNSAKNYTNNDGNLKGHFVYLNDNLNYVWTLKNWKIEPALGLNFQSLKYNYTNNHLLWDNGNHASSTETENESKNFLTATPMLAVSYKNIVNVQGGFTQDLATIVPNDLHGSRTFPFVSLAVNALPSNAKLSWKIYGSYAKMFASNNMSAFQLNDFTLFNNYYNLPYSIFSEGIWPNGPTKSTGFNERYQAGSDFSFLRKRFALGYNYLHVSSSDVTPYVYPRIAMFYLPGKYKMERHQLSLTGEVVQNKSFKWRTGMFVNFLKIHSHIYGFEFPSDEKPNTGGWTNRFGYKSFSLGADMLYMLNKDLVVTGGKSEKHSSVLLQNVYLSYSFNGGKLHNGSVYVSSRNSTDSNIMPLSNDGRRFYGGGVKFDF